MIDLSPAAKSARLQVLVALLDAQPEPGALWVLGGVRPAPGGEAAAPLAVFPLGRPAGMVAGAVLDLTLAVSEVLVQSSEMATWGRLVDGAGAWVMDMDAAESDEASAAPLQLSRVNLLGGAILRMTLARLIEP